MKKKKIIYREKVYTTAMQRLEMATRECPRCGYIYIMFKNDKCGCFICSNPACRNVELLPNENVGETV